jgi:hypothetical protein
MQWSKLKQLVRERMATSVAGRVDFHCARYRHASDGDGRCWITVDGREVADFCEFRASAAYRRMAAQLRAASGAVDYRDSAQRDAYREAGQQAVEIVHRQGLYNQREFYQALEHYLSLSVDDALVSPVLPIRALAVLDRRLGKRRLRALRLDGGEHALVRALFALRCEAEQVECAAPEA